MRLDLNKFFRDLEGRSLVGAVRIFVALIAFVVFIFGFSILVVKIPTTVKAEGQLGMRSKLLVHSETTGIIKEIDVVEGQRVLMGQKLFILGGGDSDASLRSAQMDFGEANYNLRDALEMFKQGLISRTQLARARLTFGVMWSRLKQFDQLKINASGDGVFVSDEETQVKLGTYVQAGQLLGSLFDPRYLTFEMMVPEDQIRKVEVNFGVRAEIYAYPAIKFGYLEGRVEKIVPGVIYTPAGGFFKVIADVAASKEMLEKVDISKLKEGLNGSGKILGPSKTVAYQLFDSFEGLVTRGRTSD